MNVVRRTALGITVPTLALGILATSASSAVASATVTFTGSISCAMKGSLTAKPPITFSNTTHSLTWHASLSGCTGNTTEHGVTITGGTLSASSKATASCTSLGLGSPRGTITWKANLPGAAPTTQSFSNASVSTNGGIIVVTLPGSGGTAKATGSFAGSSSKATAVIDQTENAVIAQCHQSGVSKLTFTGKNGPSSITVG